MKSKIKRIGASWFRGFSDAKQIELSDKSVAIYGENGSGKSSFVDIVEYLIKGGEIEHLRHEYRGGSKVLKHCVVLGKDIWRVD